MGMPVSEPLSEPLSELVAAPLLSDVEVPSELLSPVDVDVDVLVDSPLVSLVTVVLELSSMAATQSGFCSIQPLAKSELTTRARRMPVPRLPQPCARTYSG